MKRVFVVMPFREEFDDVYDTIRSACKAVGAELECLRCDEIEHTGYITEAFLQAIRDSDVVVADLTDSNANVMYEVGYADALEKPVILISQQEPESAPFDVRNKRLLVYDRQKLKKDLGWKVENAVRVALGRRVADNGAKAAKPDMVEAVEPQSRPQMELPPIAPTSRLTLELASFELRLEMARKQSDFGKMMPIYEDLVGIVQRIRPGNNPDNDDLRNAIGTLGNCAVEFELAEMFDEAERLWQDAIALCPQHAGVRYQYADFLVDRGRVEESTAEFARAAELKPGDPRRERLEAKISIASGRQDPSVEDRLRRTWEADKGNMTAAAAYLGYLDSIRAPIERFEEVCDEWDAHSPPGRGHFGRRALADCLAGRGEYPRARGLYEELLPSQEGRLRLAVLHNLATVTNRLGDSAAALAHWREAYAIDRRDPAVAASFSQALGRAGNHADALKVLGGEPLD